ncbi:MAG TPA: DNA alkylation repair protein, partial [Nannocystis exedens]|nr:DNA alkylation repair protein [Nannocystis exedens]
DLDRLELKERVTKVAATLARFLPKNYPDAVKIIVQAGKTWDPGEAGDPLRGFAAWPLFDFIAERGIGDLRRSMAALRSITHLFSAEFAVRPFILRYPKRAFAELTKWTRHRDEHVRRLASEGTRPRLPWATRIQPLIDDPSPVLALLEHLKDDPAAYVRRSVANNLNDIAKDHPELVIDLCEAWLEGASTERRWIVERATRTLVKAGHPRVWGLLGFTKRPKVAVSPLRLSCRRVSIGDDLSLRLTISSEARSRQRLAVDYRVYFMKAKGEQRPKVFKLKVLELAAAEVIEISKRHSFRRISTRKYYPGRHAIELLVNGEARGRAEFELC